MLLMAIVSNANDRPTNVTVTSIFPMFQTIDMIVQPNTVKEVKI